MACLCNMHSVTDCALISVAPIVSWIAAEADLFLQMRKEMVFRVPLPQQPALLLVAPALDRLFYELAIQN